jgi:hypothetical protein
MVSEYMLVHAEIFAIMIYLEDVALLPEEG